MRKLAVFVLVAGLVCGCDTAANDTKPSKKPAASQPAKDPASPQTIQPAEENDSDAADTEPAPLAEPQESEVLQNDLSAISEPSIVHAPDRQIDADRIKAAGIRSIAGTHLTLYTDLPSSPAVDEIPAAFDAAFDQWCDYFEVDRKQHQPWRMNGFLMKEKARFEASGLYPADLPPFLNGFTRGPEFWLYHQSSEYYQRHLVLHEGTHGFMLTMLGGCGPPWYMEGIAELLGTHSWQNGKLTLRHFPRGPDEVPRLGRIEIVQKDFAASQGKHLTEILGYDVRAHLKNEAYGWCWAAAAFLDGHPRYRDRFRKLHRLIHDADFNERFLEAYRNDFAELSDEWQVFVRDITYGYDLERAAIDFTPGRPLAGNADVSVRADRGWQNTGLAVAAGKTCRLQASGRFQVAEQPKPWWSEAGGVSIRYNQGKPLGMLMAAVRPPVSDTSQPSPFTTPQAIGLAGRIEPEHAGTLYLKINDSAGERADNSGELKVHIGFE